MIIGKIKTETGEDIEQDRQLLSAVTYMVWKTLCFVAILIMFMTITSAAPDNYGTTYTIFLNENGNAVWTVEYRTLLSTNSDVASFENYSKELKSVHLPEFSELMQRSASEASRATSRDMVVMDFSGDAIIQSTPTGKYGIVTYSVTWTNFGNLDSDFYVGDVFVGGLYLSKDSTLMIKYPSDFEIQEMTPKPDQTREELIWYGIRSFKTGEPRIVFKRPGFPWSMIAIILAIIIPVGAYMIKRNSSKEELKEPEIQEDIKISDFERMDVEDRIMKLLREKGGALYQSEIGRQLDLPRSSASVAINELNEKGLIQKIKKGRENLIRLK